MDWNDLLVSFLHDPPDKPLGIRWHEHRSARYIEAAGGPAHTSGEIHQATRDEDIVASAVERLPLPSPGASYERAVSPEGGELRVVHPLSGKPVGLRVCSIDEDRTEAVVRQIASRGQTPRQRFHAIWRWLPESLAAEHPCFARLPADTRLPDHTIWHHADATAAFAAAEVDGPHGMALLSFHLGPVQSFIAAARTVRDLWTGSAILSWVVVRAMRPVLEALGPTAFVFPLLRGVPIIDRWLVRDVGVAPEHSPDRPQHIPVLCLPNRFVAVVPSGREGSDAVNLAEICRREALLGWKTLATEVRDLLDSDLVRVDPRWSERWDEQVDAALAVTASALPLRELPDAEIARLLGAASFEEAFPGAAAVRALADAMPPADRPGYDQRTAGRWQAGIELSARLLEARRARACIPTRSPAREDVPGKCSQLGTWEQMGPSKPRESSHFWEEARHKISPGGVRLRARERLSAIALVKRFAAPAKLAAELGLDAGALRFPDTATVAAAGWLAKHGFDVESLRSEGDGRWSGQWLHWPRADFDPDEPAPPALFAKLRDAARKGPAPSYYAILCGDGDDMGRWLAGEKAPTVRDALHPKIAEYYGGLDGAKHRLGARRPVTPKHHAAISEALSNFAVRVVPDVVSRHFGTLIYAGGDDFLALLPSRHALRCARELRRAFSGDAGLAEADWPGFWKANRTGARNLLMMGDEASLSIGVAVVHYKEDLRDALELARKAEKEAKRCGKDALVLTIARRSGERAQTLCARGREADGAIWGFGEEIEHWVSAFEAGASPGWAYRLRALAPRLEALPIAAACAEIERQIRRTEPATQQILAGDAEETAGRRMARAYRDYEALRSGRRQGDSALPTHFEEFVSLCQSAFFLAKARDPSGGAE